MGLEYKIKFRVEDKQKIEKFLERISALFENEAAITLEDDGFYFCDNCVNSPVAAKIFYLLVQEALSGNEETTIYEL